MLDYDKLFADYIRAFKKANPRVEDLPVLEVWDSRSGWVVLKWRGPPQRLRPKWLRQMTELLLTR